MKDSGCNASVISASEEGLLIAVSGRVTSDNASLLEADIAQMRTGYDTMWCAWETTWASCSR